MRFQGMWMLSVSLLLVAVIAGCTQETQDYASRVKMIDEQVSAEAFTAIIEAINDNDAASMSKLLAKHKLDPAIHGSYSEPFLYIALRGGGSWRKATLAMLPSVADVNIVDSNGETLLHVAAMDCDVAIVGALIKAGAKVNAKDNQGRTPLHLAAEYNYRCDITELLVRSGADIEAVANNGETPIVGANRSNDVEVGSILRRLGARQ